MSWNLCIMGQNPKGATELYETSLHFPMNDFPYFDVRLGNVVVACRLKKPCACPDDFDTRP